MRFIVFKFLLLFNFITLNQVSYSQSWINVDIDSANISFDLPSSPNIHDTLNLTFYNWHVDSILTIQVHVFDSAYLNNDDTLLNLALEEDSDTLRAIAKLILFSTNSELLSIEDVNINSIIGLEIGLHYTSLLSDINTLSFIRYFLHNNKFISFIISGSIDDLPRLLSYKNNFFNSINIY